MRKLSPVAHGVLDYAVFVAFAAAPAALRFNDAAAVASCHVAAAMLLLLTLLTRYPLGPGKLVPYRVHGVLELLAAPLLALFPWLAGFAAVPGARAFFLASGAALLVLWSFTDYRAADAVAADAAPAADVTASRRDRHAEASARSRPAQAFSPSRRVDAAL